MTAGGPLRGFAGLLLGLVLLAPVTAATLTGRVVRILDGDTVEVLNAAQDPERVRLGGIDAPEKAQPFGTQSKQHLADLAGGQAVIVEWKKRDRHGRVVGTLLRDGRDLGLQMVREGYAWWYRAFAEEQSPVDRVLYAAAEQSARTARRGAVGGCSPHGALGLPPPARADRPRPGAMPLRWGPPLHRQPRRSVLRDPVRGQALRRPCDAMRARWTGPPRWVRSVA